MKVLIACEFSGVVRDAFAKKGHDAWSCDILPSESWHPIKYSGDLKRCELCDEPLCEDHSMHFDQDRGSKHFQGDVLEVLDQDWDLMIAHPPCTYLTVTGAKWFYHPDDKGMPVEERRPHPKFPNRRQQQNDAADFFLALAKSGIPRFCIENPVGVMSKRYRKPDQIIQPFQFGHPEPKKTCLWLHNLPPLVATSHVEPDYITTKSGKRVPRWFFEPSPSKGRQKSRSVTFQGIADAMADQWG